MKKSFFLCWTILAVITSQAQIIHVHPDSAYSTIQSGINAASPGDTVLVGDAVYYEQISFLGKKPLMVASYYLMDGDTNHIANTIIDGDSITDTENGSIVNFKSGEDTTSVLMGFTIRNGNTGTLDFFGIYKVRCGGGIFINQSGAKILHNHITQNHLDDITLPGSPYVVQGAGIFSSWLESEYWIVIQDNVVDFNSCSSKSLQAGSGGVSVGYNAIILNNIVKYNTATGNATASAIAGGLACATDVALNLNVKSVVTGNIISNNKVKSPPTSWANSAGFLAQGYQCTFNGNTVSENYVDCSANGSGVAGARSVYSKPGTSLSGNIFEGDTTLGWGGAFVSIPLIQMQTMRSSCWKTIILSATKQ